MDLRSLIPFSRSAAPSRPGVDYDPFTAMRREMDRMFEDFGRGVPALSQSFGNGFLSPKVDVAETATGLEVTAELPGVDQKDIELDLTDGVLTLRASHASEKEEKDEGKRYHLVERSTGTYLRRFALPFPADEDKVEASFDKGVLKIVVPKAANAEKPAKKIEVKGS